MRCELIKANTVCYGIHSLGTDSQHQKETHTCNVILEHQLVHNAGDTKADHFELRMNSKKLAGKEWGFS